MEIREMRELLDWKRQIFELYARVRRAEDPQAAWHEWRATRDELFAEHPQSPLTEGDRLRFERLRYYKYDPAARVSAPIQAEEPQRYEIGTSGSAPYAFERIGRVDLELPEGQASLEVYWLEGYGGGLFLPFRDVTSGRETYGAGRYLLDTVKGADLGTEGQALVLDFNFAYHPSCAYDPRWVCPLAPPPNRIEIPIRAGERSE